LRLGTATTFGGQHFNEKVRLYDNGNVTIGPAGSPVELKVNGTVTAAEFVGDGSGLTGINTLDKLTVNGATTLEGNVAIGSAGKPANLTILGTVTATHLLKVTTGGLLKRTGGNSGFGYSVAISGDTICVGSPFEEDSKGVIYTYSRHRWGINHWGQSSRTTISEASNHSTCGQTVAIAGKRLAVGAPNGKKVYLFIDRPSSFPSAAYPPPGKDNDRTTSYGQSVAVEGNIVVIGDPYADNEHGAVHIYDNFTQGKRITPSVSKSRFGQCVAVDEKFLIVGAPGEQTSRGAVYIYQYNSGNNMWEMDGGKPITEKEGKARNFFGHSVAIAEDTIVVGAPSKYGKGAVHIYKRNPTENKWEFLQKLNVIRNVVGSEFGHCVAIAKDTLIVGEPQTTVGEHERQGAAYIYQRNSRNNMWELLKVLTADDGQAKDNFGWSVAISEDMLVVGTKHGNAAYIGSVPGSTVAGFALKHSSDNQGFTLQSNGVALNILRHDNDANGVSALSINRQSGNVGIGTTLPSTKLEVEGSVKALGLQVANVGSGTPITRIVAGSVNSDGSVGTGSGFSSKRQDGKDKGVYVVTFDAAFTSTPICLATCSDTDQDNTISAVAETDKITIYVYDTGPNGGNLEDGSFSFVAFGLGT
ncbi:MAG: hypothetical protein GY796_27185, partial [Chloroflexi bacterium]|nr:hypothetical protein [Chloroflexota bacterium]